MTSSGTFLAYALAELGYVEGPRNATKFAAIAGHADYQPWCATFLVAVAERAGLTLPPGATSAYTPAMLNAFRRDDREVAHPRPGDFGFVYYPTMGRVGHVFAVVDVLEDGLVRTIEGNTDQALSRTGGRVAQLLRRYSDDPVRGQAYVAAFARPEYEAAGDSIVGSVLPAALASPGGSALGPDLLKVDGALGPLTISRWQAVAGTTVDGWISRPSELVRAVQEVLNREDRAALAVDGRLGPQTIRALQHRLGTPADGVISTPVSEMVSALQVRLNAGSF